MREPPPVSDFETPSEVGEGYVGGESDVGIGDERSEVEECDAHDGQTDTAKRYFFTPPPSPTYRAPFAPVTSTPRRFSPAPPPSTVGINTRIPRTPGGSSTHVTRTQLLPNSDESEEWDIDGHRHSALEGWSYARPKCIPPHSLTSYAPPSPPSLSTTGTKPRKPRTHPRGTFRKRQETQPFQYSGKAVYESGVYNNSYNTTTNKTRNSYNDTSITIGD